VRRGRLTNSQTPTFRTHLDSVETWASVDTSGLSGPWLVSERCFLQRVLLRHLMRDCLLRRTDRADRRTDALLQENDLIDRDDDVLRWLNLFSHNDLLCGSFVEAYRGQRELWSEPLSSEALEKSAAHHRA
jgi:hypothetical protein